MIIPSDALQHLSSGVRDILQLISLNYAAIYVREPLPSGHNRICILQHNLRQDPLNPQSSNFEDIIVGWYCDLLLDGNHSTNPLDLTTISLPPTASIHLLLKTHSLIDTKHMYQPLFSCGSQMTVLFDGFAKTDNSF
jgi:hypothetical protein